jgi:hypothetical protein
VLGVTSIILGVKVLLRSRMEQSTNEIDSAKLEIPIVACVASLLVPIDGQAPERGVDPDPSVNILPLRSSYRPFHWHQSEERHQIPRRNHETGIDRKSLRLESVESLDTVFLNPSQEIAIDIKAGEKSAVNSLPGVSEKT